MREREAPTTPGDQAYPEKTVTPTPAPDTHSESALSPLRFLDVEAVGEAAKRETRNREVHLPPIGVYRWWARRTEAVNGALIDAMATARSTPLLVADPFAGGGVIPLAAVLRGHRVYAQDLNPWAARGLTAMLGLPDAGAIDAAREQIAEMIAPTIEKAYGTKLADGRDANVSQTLRVASACCHSCGERFRLFPHALVSLKKRRESGGSAAFLACSAGHLFEGVEGKRKRCPECRRMTDPAKNYTNQRVVKCPFCAEDNKLDVLATRGKWRWDVVLVERALGSERELALPTQREVRTAADRSWAPALELGVVPKGQETAVLLRHGFKHWHDLYPKRQRVVMERLLAHAAEASDDPHVVEAVRLSIIGAAEMAGYLSRWDRFYLKSYESMANHRFNFSTLVVEPNVWGAEQARGRGTVRRRLERLSAIADWMHTRVGRTLNVSFLDDITHGSEGLSLSTDVLVVEGSSERQALPTGAADLVLTDPPYHDDVEYDELSLPFRAWASQSLARLTASATANSALRHNTQAADYESLLSRIFNESARVLGPSGHLIFSYANREPDAWCALFSALRSAGLRACGVAFVHSENETDLAKRGVRACTLDLVMDLVRADVVEGTEGWVPDEFPDTDEGRFLAVLARHFVRIGAPDTGDWRDDLRTDLAASPFLQ